LTKIRWLYSQILAEDANFKQKARARSNITKDPPLGPGWGTFVENEAYIQHIATAPNKTEVLFTVLFFSIFFTCVQHIQISHCVGFAAMWNANSKKSEGLRATGIGAVVCARHALYLPNGMGDLQKGERCVS
jgi:Kyakuja-Dileera-Zisupton transposase